MKVPSIYDYDILLKIFLCRFDLVDMLSVSKVFHFSPTFVKTCCLYRSHRNFQNVCCILFALCLLLFSKKMASQKQYILCACKTISKFGICCKAYMRGDLEEGSTKKEQKLLKPVPQSLETSTSLRTPGNERCHQPTVLRASFHYGAALKLAQMYRC